MGAQRDSKLVHRAGAYTCSTGCRRGRKLVHPTTPGRSPVRLWSGFGSYCVRSRDHLVGLSTNVVLVAPRDLDHTSKYFAAAGALPVTVSRSQDCIGCREVNGDTVDNRCDLCFLGRSGVRIMTPQDHKVSLHAHSSRRGCLGLPDERDRMSAQPLARRSRSQCRRARSASQRQMMTADQPDDAAVPPWRREGSLPDARCA